MQRWRETPWRAAAVDGSVRARGNPGGELLFALIKEPSRDQAMNRFIATVTVTLHFDDGRSPVTSKKQAIEFEAEADDADEAWDEFLEGSSLDMVEFPKSVDPFDPSVIDEQWEHHGVRGAD